MIASIRPWVRAHGLDVAIVGGIALFLFPQVRFGLATGVDPSWMAGLGMAADDGLVFGRDLVYTYGPLGFTGLSRLTFPSTWYVATFVQLLAIAALVALFYRLLHRSLPRWFAAAATAGGLLLVLGVVQRFSGVLSFAVGMIAVLVGLDAAISPALVRIRWAVGAGAFVAATALFKLDSGSFVAAVLGVALVANVLANASVRDLIPRVAAFLGSIVAFLVGLWLVLGQPLGALLDWLRTSSAVIAGYSDAMALEVPRRRIDYPVALVAVIALAAGIGLTRSVPWRRRLAVGAVLAMAAYLGFRQGFVRHDEHVEMTAAVLVAIGVGLMRFWGPRLGGLVAVSALVMFALIARANVRTALDPVQRLRADAASIRFGLDRAGQTDEVHEHRAALRATLPFTPSLLDPARGGTIHISPSDAAIAWAHPELVWDPLPVFQDYVAYTTALDRLNADELAGPGRPDYVLRQRGVSVDNRLPRWESPEATLALACRYRIIGEDRDWALLQAGEDRCGQPVEMTRRDAAFGEVIAVPAAPGPDDIVVARFAGIGTGPLDRVRSALFKGRELSVDVGIDGPHRFVAGTQGSWHVVRAPACAAQLIDGRPDAETLEFSADGGDPSASFTVELASVTFHC